MVLKKLDDELLNEFIKALKYLALEEKMKVIVEPHEFEKLVCPIDLPSSSRSGFLCMLFVFVDLTVHCADFSNFPCHAQSMLLEEIHLLYL